LPVEARNVVHLLSLQPGAVFIPTTNPNTTDPRYGATAGARADQQNVTLDGIDVNDPQLQAAFTSAVRMTQEALQEFKVSTTNYGAEMGRSSGPQVSLVTRSGTNEYNGSAYWFLRRTSTSSNEYFLKLAQLGSGKESKVPKLDKDIFGGALGGPLRRGKAFFFGNFEALREQSEAPVVRAVPSPSLRDGVLMYRCASASACPGGTVRGFNNTHTVPAGWYGLTPAEIAAIERFLPAQMSDEEARAAISAIIAETGASAIKDMGRVMAEVKARHSGALEPARASALVKQLLGG